VPPVFRLFRCGWPCYQKPTEWKSFSPPLLPQAAPLVAAAGGLDAADDAVVVGVLQRQAALCERGM
jgi:hypothetical protein